MSDLIPPPVVFKALLITATGFGAGLVILVIATWAGRFIAGGRADDGIQRVNLDSSSSVVTGSSHIHFAEWGAGYPADPILPTAVHVGGRGSMLLCPRCGYYIHRDDKESAS